MKRPSRRALAHFVVLPALLVPAVWHVWTLVTLFSGRVLFPMDLEWMESGHIYHAYRLTHHLPIYINPARGFAPFPYPPLFWLVIGAVGEVFGLDYWTGRAISIASVAGVATIFCTRLLRRAPKAFAASFALVSIASIGAGYPLSGGSFDLARSDSFATFLPVAAAALVGDGRQIPMRRCLMIAVMLIASVYAKQTGIFFSLWILAFAFAQNRKTGAAIAVVTLLGASALAVVLASNSGGWFFVWLFDMRHHEILPRETVDPLLTCVRHAPFILLLPVLAIILRRRGWLRGETVKWLGVLGAAIVSAVVAHMKAGGWLNVYVPMLMIAWPVVLLTICDLLDGLNEVVSASANAHAQKTSTATFALVATPWLVLVCSAAVLVTLAYDRQRYVPTAEMTRSAQKFHRAIAALDGEVVVATMPFVAVRAGKSCSQPILQAYFDGANAGIHADYGAALDASGAKYVVVTGTWLDDRLPSQLESWFEHVDDGESGFDRDLTINLDSPGVTHPFPKGVWRRRAREVK